MPPARPRHAAPSSASAQVGRDHRQRQAPAAAAAWEPTCQHGDARSFNRAGTLVCNATPAALNLSLVSTRLAADLNTCCNKLKTPGSDPTCPRPGPAPTPAVIIVPTPAPAPPATNVTCYNVSATLEGLAAIQQSVMTQINSTSDVTKVWLAIAQLSGGCQEGCMRGSRCGACRVHGAFSGVTAKPKSQQVPAQTVMLPSPLL